MLRASKTWASYRTQELGQHLLRQLIPSDLVSQLAVQEGALLMGPGAGRRGEGQPGLRNNSIFYLFAFLINNGILQSKFNKGGCI